MSLKRGFAVAVMLVVFISFAGALPPSFVLGAYAEGGDSSAVPSLGTPYTDARFQGSFGWRQALSAGSYLAVTSRASIAPFVTALSGFVDTELVNAELGLPVGPGTLIFDVGEDSSLSNQTGVGAYGRPAWSAEYRWLRSEAGFRPSVSYLGSFLTEQTGSDDHLSQALRFTLDKESSVRLETWSAFQGGWELWTKQQAVDASGAVIGPRRQDWLGELSVGARGFAGFSVDWALEASAGVRSSDASTSSATYSQLVLPGGSRFTAKGSASLSWTPSRQLNVSINGRVQDDAYFTRLGVSSDGTASDAALNVLDAGAGLKADWTPDNAFFIVIEASVDRRFANDPNVAQWNGTVSAGIEYSF